LFIFGGKITAFVRERIAQHVEHHASKFTLVAGTFIQLALAIYIGYFGAGAGIIMLALFAVMGMENIHTMNAFKSLLATCANGIAVITFIIFQKVLWMQAGIMIIGAMIGGYFGAWYAQKLDPKHVRYVVIAIGCTMTAYFTWKIV
jgi:uncharacterized membrane protein YfcA